MELMEMKNLWEEMSEELEHQKTLTDKLIMDMTKERYRNRFQRMISFESIGALICFGAGFYVLMNFGKLDAPYLIASGVFCIAYLFLIPMFTLRSMYKMKNLNIRENNYRQTLVDFSRARQEFQFITQLALYLNVVLLVAISLVFLRFKGKTDMLQNTDLWYYFIPMGIGFLFFFSRWGYKCYRNMTHSAEHILHELELEEEYS